MSSAEKVVCVTGASGFIASWIVKFLLQRGYTVKATVLDINNPDQTQHLLALDGAKERIHLFEAELTEEGSFDSAVDGCEGVFHTASPVSFSKDDPQAELIDPAVKGTLNVLQSCAKVPSIKRVVVTSSLGSVIFTGKPFTPDVVVDETWYSDPAFCEKSKLWYMLSKTLAERAAWEFAKENRIDLVTMNPGIVIGPLLPPILNLSVKIILNLIDGSQTFQNSSYRYVDVRDVANAHILAFEKPSASGRYILAGKSVHNDEAIKILHSLYPSLPLPAKCDDSSYFGIEVQKYEVSTEKAKGIGVEFTPLEASIRDTVESLKEKGHFKP